MIANLTVTKTNTHEITLESEEIDAMITREVLRILRLPETTSIRINYETQDDCLFRAQVVATTTEIQKVAGTL